MVFASITFLLLFLPPALAGYFAILAAGKWVLPERWRLTALNLWLFMVSVLFYASGERRFVFVMFITATTDFLAGLIISGGRREPLDPHGPRTPLQRGALITAIAINLLLLGFFKYLNFGLTNLGALSTMFGMAPPAQWDFVQNLTLPLGISFYTFQSMSYTIDVYNGEVAATRSFLDFATLVTMFPHLIAGPIIRYRHIGPQLHGRRVNLSLAASGIRRFIVGLAKKTLVANAVATLVDRAFDLPAGQMTTAVAWLAAIGYAIQIYFDFSGYSDMAIGLGRIFGFEFLENFSYPYAAASVTEFWRRWHISLSTWFRDYLYVPLGGSHRGTFTTYRNLLIVFFLCGLWHGAQWTFICWGLYHGAFLIVERVGLREKVAASGRFFSHLYTMVVVLVGWVIFRAPGIVEAGRVLRAMAGAGASGGLEPIALFLTPTTIVAMIAGAITSLPVVPAVCEWWWSSTPATGDSAAPAWTFGGSLTEVATLTGLLVLSFMSLAAGTYNPFIYFRF